MFDHIIDAFNSSPLLWWTARVFWINLFLNGHHFDLLIYIVNSILISRRLNSLHALLDSIDILSFDNPPLNDPYLILRLIFWTIRLLVVIVRPSLRSCWNRFWDRRSRICVVWLKNFWMRRGYFGFFVLLMVYSFSVVVIMFIFLLVGHSFLFDFV